MKLTEYESKSIDKLSESIQDGKFSNDGLVQLIQCAGAYLNLKTIPEYATDNKMSYNGVKKFRNVIEIFKTKFVIEND